MTGPRNRRKLIVIMSGLPVLFTADALNGSLRADLTNYTKQSGSAADAKLSIRIPKQQAMETQFLPMSSCALQALCRGMFYAWI